MVIFVLLGIVIVLLAFVSGMWYNDDTSTQNMFTIAFLCTAIGFVYLCVAISNEFIQKNIELEFLKVSKSNYYYMEASIYAQVPTNDGQYKIIFADNHSPRLFAWTSTYAYDKDAPYILNMDSKGTDDISNDEIMVVWKDMY